jgi:predicted XRE-type DNA-binding protein
MAQLTQHWTEENAVDYVYRISSDFMTQIENKMDEKKVTRKEFADGMKVSTGRVSQIFNHPGNATLKQFVRCARVLGMKVALVAYDDGDARNENGPINSQIFVSCWTKEGKPSDFFSMEKPISIPMQPKIGFKMVLETRPPEITKDSSQISVIRFFGAKKETLNEPNPERSAINAGSLANLVQP